MPVQQRKKKNWVDFAAVKAQVRIADVVNRYGLELQTKGPEMVGLCPFHEDSKPSFRVNTDKQVFHCFGCGAKGNVLDFVARKEGVQIKRAAQLLAGWFGIAADASDAPGATSKADNRPPEETLPKSEGNRAPPGSEGNKPLTFTLQLEPEHPYLTARHLEPATIETFGVGYCDRGLMKGRVAIPIHDAGGDLVAYAGRWVGSDEDLPEGEGKYQLPPKFQKSQVLFNLHRVPRDTKIVVLVEGYFSVLWLTQLGFPNVVALMGTALSDTQRRLLSERFKGVRLFFDGDKSGQEASTAVAGELAQELWVKAVRCPDGEQPDQLDPDVLNSLLA